MLPLMSHSEFLILLVNIKNEAGLLLSSCLKFITSEAGVAYKVLLIKKRVYSIVKRILQSKYIFGYRW